MTIVRTRGYLLLGRNSSTLRERRWTNRRAIVVQLLTHAALMARISRHDGMLSHVIPNICVQ